MSPGNLWCLPATCFHFKLAQAVRRHQGLVGSSTISPGSHLKRSKCRNAAAVEHPPVNNLARQGYEWSVWMMIGPQSQPLFLLLRTAGCKGVVKTALWAETLLSIHLRSGLRAVNLRKGHSRWWEGM